MKKHILRGLVVTKVSSVEAGSNPGADILILKAKPVVKATFNEVMAAQALRAAIWKIYDTCYVMQDAMYSSLNSEDPTGEIRASVEQFAAFVNKQLDALESIPTDPGSVQKAMADAVTRGEAFIAKVKENHMTAEQIKKLQDDLAAAQAKVEELTKQSAQAESKTPPTEDVIKALPPEAQAIIVKAQSDAKAASDRAEQAEAIAKEERTARIRRETLMVVKEKYPYLPGSDDEKVDMLISVDALPEAVKKTTLATMAASNAALAQVFKGSGHASSGNGDESPESRLRAKATELRKSDPKMTDAEAYTLAMSQNPDLYRAHQESRASH